MKRLLLAFFGVLLLLTAGPLPVASARGWWWHHSSHSKSSPAAPGKKVKSSKAPSEKHGRNTSEPLYSFPKTVGWWHHKGPGPAGAGVK